MMNFIKKIDWRLWGTGLAFAFVLPILTKMTPMSRAMWVGLVLFIINCCFSIWIGKYEYQKEGKWWELFVFPILFLLVAVIWMPHYTYYFALAYLAISYLSCSLRKAN